MNRAAFIAIVGRPSAGKSTLLNRLCGWKVAIVSRTPQTTRNRIRGIVNSGDCQLVFVDTPGFHDSEKKLNANLRKQAEIALDECDLVLYMGDGTRAPGEEDKKLAEVITRKSGKLVCAINKLDEAGSKPEPFVAFFKERFPGAKIFGISALDGRGVDELLKVLVESAPESEHFYPEDFATDQEPEFRIAEIIREKVFLHTHDELPHSVYVEITDAKMNPEGTSLKVRAFLAVERDSQKGMLIGKGGDMIKTIRVESERDLADIFPYKVKLDIQVKVDKNWRQNDDVIGRLGSQSG